jgi:hypothetical protein
MGFLDRAKATAEQAAARVQEGVEDVQVKRDLGQVYGELGRVAYALARRGEISHPELTPVVDRIVALEARADAGTQAAPGGFSGGPDAATPVTPEQASGAQPTAEQQMPG